MEYKPPFLTQHTHPTAQPDKPPRVPIAQTQPKRFLLQSAPLVLAWQFLPCSLNGKQGFGGHAAVYLACIYRQNGLRCPRNGETVYALHVQCVAAANKPLAACPAAGKVSLAVVLLLDGACCKLVAHPMYAQSRQPGYRPTRAACMPWCMQADARTRGGGVAR